MEAICYEDLSAAIIEQAVIDYKMWLREHYVKKNRNAPKHIKKLEDFFKSEWFNSLATLCNLNISDAEIIKTVKNRVRTKCTNHSRKDG